MTAVPKPKDIRKDARPARGAGGARRSPAPEAVGREIGEILVRLGRLDPAGLEKILEARTARGDAFGAAAQRLGLLKADDVQTAVAIRHGYLEAGPQALSLPKDLVLLKRPASREAEAFRLLRTRLLTTQAEKLGLFSVVGAGRASRAEYVAANLAAGFAQMKRRVLLIDACLRAPRLAGAFAMKNAAGLGAVLDGSALLEDSIVATPVVNLSLLATSTRNAAAADLLAEKGLRRLFDEARAAFDIVMVLTPPLGSLADGQLVLSETRTAVVVVRRNEARLEALTATQSVLRQLGADALGAVLTG